MFIADLHCDTILDIFKEENCHMKSNRLHIDCEKLKSGGYILQNFAMFTNISETKSLFKHVNSMIDKYYDELSMNSAVIAPATSYKEIEENSKSNKISAVLTIEEGEVCEGSIENLKALYGRGVRMMTFTWNFKNSLGSPNSNENKEAFVNTREGLTEKGFEFLYEMNNLGIIPDVSHLSDKGFFDVADNTRCTFVASHSNAREICSHPRNLTDEMIKKISEKNGIIGLNYCNSFISDNYIRGKGIEIEAFIPHINHIIKIGGDNCLSLGTDFDGIDNPPIEIPNASKQFKLVELLYKNGFKDNTIEKICYKNVLRVYKENLK